MKTSNIFQPQKRIVSAEIVCGNTVFVSYFDLLSFDNFLEKKNLYCCLLKAKWLMKICIFRGTLNFSSNYNVHFLHQPPFLEGSALNFYSPKKFVKYDITRASGLAQVCYKVNSNIIFFHFQFDSIRWDCARCSRSSINYHSCLMFLLFVLFFVQETPSIFK